MSSTYLPNAGVGLFSDWPPVDRDSIPETQIKLLLVSAEPAENVLDL